MEVDLTWINFYMEFADKLLEYKNNRKDLIKKIYNLFDELNNIKIATLDKDKNSKSIIARDIDPFTVFALFNKRISYENRISITNKIKEKFNLNSKAPTNFDGIPLVNNQNATFYGNSPTNGDNVKGIWKLFEAAINYSKDSKNHHDEFINSYNEVITYKYINWKVTMALFWIRPNLFINLDRNNREFLSIESNLSEKVSQLIKPLKKGPNAEDYLKICEECKIALENNNLEYNTFVELSKYAYENNSSDKIEYDKINNASADNDIKTTYWLYSPGEGAISWEEFYKEGIMAIGWDDTGNLKDLKSKKDIKKKLKRSYHYKQNPINMVNALWQFANDVQIGDIIFAKKGIKEIIGRGVVESNYEYDEDREYFKHVRKVKWDNKGNWNCGKKIKGYYRTLVNISHRKEKIKYINELIGDEEPLISKYDKKDFLKEVYINEKDYDTLVNLLKNKKNLIVEGAPGVGKTFLAKRLAYSIMGLKDFERVMMVQFHQSYSYEDFIMGYKPSQDGFELKTGPFYDFCKKAEDDNDNDYFFIIDEINRGNISKIFGELFMLIENDKRGDKYKIQLLYSGESFFIPENLHIIGLMNTADRSLAMIDYALRRRFSFFLLKPGFESEGFKSYQSKIQNSYFDKTIQTIKELNNEIKEDETLGEGFKIGHSYFCNIKPDEDDKLNYIIEYEIIPLLKEYWFDEAEKVKIWSEKLKNILRE